MCKLIHRYNHLNFFPFLGLEDALLNNNIFTSERACNMHTCHSPTWNTYIGLLLQLRVTHQLIIEGLDALGVEKWKEELRLWPTVYYLQVNLGQSHIGPQSAGSLKRIWALIALARFTSTTNEYHVFLFLLNLLLLLYIFSSHLNDGVGFKVNQ